MQVALDLRRSVSALRDVAPLPQLLGPRMSTSKVCSRLLESALESVFRVVDLLLDTLIATKM